MVHTEHRKISQAAKEMYVAVNEMRKDLTKMASKHFDDSFKNEGFTYNTLWKWQPRKRPNRYTHKILQKSGKLRKSIKSNVFTTKESFEVRFKSNVIYAKIHNEGLMGMAYGKHPFKMPKRQFMGYSRVLDLKIQRMFDKKIRKIWRS